MSMNIFKFRITNYTNTKFGAIISLRSITKNEEERKNSDAVFFLNKKDLFAGPQTRCYTQGYSGIYFSVPASIVIKQIKQ